MTKPEQIILSDFIKSIHKKLREEANILGTEEAWKKHCTDGRNLEKYASAMQQLAVDYWDQNSGKDQKGQKVISRVLWIYTACKDYFTDIKNYRDKESNIVKSCYKYESCLIFKPIIPILNKEVKYNLLDVGSCYNPFRQYELFKVLPIDIAPANKEVFKCDFLNLKICSRTIIRDQMIIQLKEDWFDVIVFSLLLEYFPCPKQRLKCCLNAYKLLKHEGILTIVTPDSNHVGSNAKIFKSWQFILARHGFIRIKYEKLPYIHCMMFRKTYSKPVAQRWAEVHGSENYFQEMFIPQDFTKRKCKEVKLLKNMDTKDQWNKNTFLKDLDSSICE